MGINTNIKEVSLSSELLCQDFIEYKNGYYITLLNNEIIFPFNGVVISKCGINVSIDIGSNIIYILSYDNIELNIYEHINENDIIGYSNSYYIYSNNFENLKLLNYKVYDEKV